MDFNRRFVQRFLKFEQGRYFWAAEKVDMTPSMQFKPCLDHGPVTYTPWRTAVFIQDGEYQFL